MDSSWLLEAIGKADIGLWQWDARADEFILTETFLNLVGDASAEGARSVEEALAYVCPADREKVQSELKSISDHGVDFRFQWRPESNHNRWLESVGEVIRDDEGNVLSIQGATYDITELVQSRQELSDTHGLYQTVLASAGMAVYRFDFDADEYRNANLALIEKFCGQPYRGNHAEFWARVQVTDIRLLGELAGMTIAEAIRAFRSGDVESWRTEAKILRPDGKTSWILDFAYLLKDATGKAIGSFGIMQDITELKLLASSVEQIVAATGRADVDYLEQLAESIGKTLGVEFAMIAELLPDSHSQIRTLALVQNGQTLASETIELEGRPLQTILKDGQCFTRHSLKKLELPGSVIAKAGIHAYLGVELKAQDGSPIGLMALFHKAEIDEAYNPVRVLQLFASHAAAELERRKTEVSIKESEAFYRSLFSVQSEGIVVQDESDRILAINKSAQQCLRMTDEDLLGRNSLDPKFKLVNMDGTPWDPAQAPSVLAVQTGKPQTGRVYGMKFDDGETTWISVNAMPIEGIRSPGQRHVVVSFTDITERLNTQRQLERLNSELEQVISERTEELQRANRELESFAYSVSHDLRQPLRAIDGFSRILEMDYGDKLDEEGLENISTIRNATRRMSNLIDDLLRLSRLISHDIELQPIDLSALAQDTWESLANSTGDREIAFSVEPNLHTEGDRSLIRAVLDNLLQNAIKFTSKKPTATIRVGQAEGAYFVRDDGEGFDMQYSDKLFEPFQRLHSPREFEGSGIGLATVRRIIERHRGKVWADAAVGQGATFYFSLTNHEKAPVPAGGTGA